jgi:hypothetical protein
LVRLAASSWQVQTPAIALVQEITIDPAAARERWTQPAVS